MKRKTPLRDQLDHYLAPGVWVDKEGGLHFSLPDILKDMNLPDTPENRAYVTTTLKEMLHKQTPRATIIEREKPDSEL